MSYSTRPSKTAAWREHVRKNLAAEVIMYEKVEINISHALPLTKIIAKLISWAKRGDLHARRLSLRYLQSRKNTIFKDKITKTETSVLEKLFVTLAKRYEKRAGGYTRTTKSGYRRGDSSPTVIVSLV